MTDPSGVTHITYTAGGSAAFGGSDFSAIGLTVGSTGASADLESSPETRTFSSPMLAIVQATYELFEVVKVAKSVQSRGRNQGSTTVGRVDGVAS